MRDHLVTGFLSCCVSVAIIFPGKFPCAESLSFLCSLKVKIFKVLYTQFYTADEIDSLSDASMVNHLALGPVFQDF